jgi:DNA-directed RNA polymerase subunit H (RpoH/RPB5)
VRNQDNINRENDQKLGDIMRMQVDSMRNQDKVNRENDQKLGDIMRMQVDSKIQQDALKVQLDSYAPMLNG